MTAGREPPMRDFLIGAGFGGAERDRSEVPLVRGKDDAALIIAAQSGMSGFAARKVVDAPKQQPKAQPSWPSRAAAPARVERVEPPAQRPRFNGAYAFGGALQEDAKPTQTPAVASPTTTSQSARPGPQAVVISVAPGGDAAFQAVEARLGTPLSAIRRTGRGALWGERRTPDGGREIGFSTDLHQRLALAPLAGDLGTSMVKLRIGTPDTSGFRRAGPGATGRDATGSLPQISDQTVEALFRCFG